MKRNPIPTGSNYLNLDLMMKVIFEIVPQSDVRLIDWRKKVPTAPKILNRFESLVEVVAHLRGPEGCPWDKEQTLRTLTQYAIEEAHEFAEAVDKNDIPGTVEELGDLLLQVILNAEIAKQEGKFTLADVISGITEKMIRRHPHVFGDVKVDDSRQVLENWSHLKEKEKAKETNPFASIPKAIPALIRAQKIGAKTVRFNFDWSKPEEVIAKLDEEVQELKYAIKKQTLEEQQLELGDVLFTVVQLARHLNFDAEQALRLTNQKFENRFVKMREIVANENRNFSDLTIAELENYWQKAKTLTL
jgi:tetrapyrrole methylase family protein / MazG family protein